MDPYKPSKKPTCKSCGGEHFNFQPCSAAYGVGAKRLLGKARPGPAIEDAPQEGIRRFGDRLHNYRRIGEGNLVLGKGVQGLGTGEILPPRKEG